MFVPTWNDSELRRSKIKSQAEQEEGSGRAEVSVHRAKTSAREERLPRPAHLRQD